MTTTNFSLGDKGGIRSANATWSTARAGSNLTVQTTGSSNVLLGTSNNSEWAGGYTAFGAGYKTYEGFIDFDTSALPNDAEVTSATLALLMNGLNAASDVTVQVRSVDWGGGTVTTGDFIAGASLGTVIASQTITAGSSSDYYNLTIPGSAINLTGDTRFVVGDSRQTSATNPADARLTALSVAGGYPSLSVTYATVPNAPSGLSATGAYYQGTNSSNYTTASALYPGMTDSDVKVAWTYNTSSDSGAQTGYQVQVATDAGFSSLIYDSSKVSSAYESLSISSLLGTLTASTTYYYRVRTYGAAVAASSWVSSSFTTAKGLIDVTPIETGKINKAIANNLTWTYTQYQGTQSIYRVKVYKTSDSSLVHDSTSVASSAGTYSLPANTLSTSTSYDWTVTVSDGTTSITTELVPLKTATAPSSPTGVLTNGVLVQSTPSQAVTWSFSDGDAGDTYTHYRMTPGSINQINWVTRGNWSVASSAGTFNYATYAGAPYWRVGQNGGAGGATLVRGFSNLKVGNQYTLSGTGVVTLGSADSVNLTFGASGGSSGSTATLNTGTSPVAPSYSFTAAGTSSNLTLVVTGASGSQLAGLSNFSIVATGADAQTAYQIVVTTGATTTYDSGKVMSASNSSAIPSGTLAASTSYTLSVTVWDSYDQASTTSTYAFTTLPLSSLTITAPVDGSSGFSSSFLTSWNFTYPSPATAQASWSILVKKTSDNTTAFSSSGANTNTSVTVTGMTSPYQYSVKVTATDNNAGTANQTIYVTVDYSRPRDPDVSIVVHETYVEVDVDSTTQGSRPLADYYEIYRAISGTDTWEYMGIVDGGDGTFNDYRIAANTQYDYKARAVKE